MMRLLYPILILLNKPWLVMLFRHKSLASSARVRVYSHELDEADHTDGVCCCRESACDSKHENDLAWHQYQTNGSSYCCKWKSKCDYGGLIGWIATNYHHDGPTLVKEGKISLPYANPCSQPECPKGTKADGPGYCACEDGKSGRSEYEWQTSKYPPPNCHKNDCPTHAEGRDGKCECKKGYTGKVTWNDVEQTWRSTCSRSRCPGEARDFPDCKCPSVGYKGQLKWDANAGWTGHCARVHCPLPATGHPNCVCPKGHDGSITWDDNYKIYTGECKPTWTFMNESHKTCDTVIEDPNTCKLAGDHLGIKHSGLTIVQHQMDLPYGCFLRGRYLYFSKLNASYSRRSDGRHLRYKKGIVQICGSKNMPSKCAWDMFDTTGPKFYDVQQGDIGTCYFLASVAAVAHFQPQLLEDMFVSKGCVTRTKHGDKCIFPFVYDGVTYNSCTNINNTAAWCATKIDPITRRLVDGRSWDYCAGQADDDCQTEESKYARLRTQWQINGQLVTVAVDDKFPTNKRGHPHFVKYNSGHHFWPMVLEKAWAKIYGSFKNVELGVPVESLMAITKGPVAQFAAVSRMSETDLWSTLVDDVLAMSAPCVASTHQADNGKLYGLPFGHSFTVIDARQLANGKKVIQMYNPWGKQTYTGEMKEMQGHDSTFFMTLKEFHSAIREIDYAYSRPGYKSSSQAVEVKGNSLEAEVSFKLQDASEFWYMVTWPTARLVSDKSNCSHVMPDVKSDLTHTADDYEMALPQLNSSALTHAVGHAWRKYKPMGVRESYRLHFEIDFKQVTWVPEVSVVVYAKGEATFGDLKVRDRSKIAGAAQIYGTGAPINEKCAAFVKRVKDLDNHVSIRKTGEDDKFPPVVSSIGSGDCGDPAQDKQLTSCEKYNNWKTLDEVACPVRV